MPDSSYPTEAEGVEVTGREAHLLKLLRACRRWVEEAGTIQGEAWDRGDYKAPLGSETIRNEDGEFVAHITRAPWGIGSYTDLIPEAADLLAAIDCALAPKAIAAATGTPT